MLLFPNGLEIASDSMANNQKKRKQLLLAALTRRRKEREIQEVTPSLADTKETG